MITDNPDTNNSPAESPSSRPMTLRQQLPQLYYWTYDHTKVAGKSMSPAFEKKIMGLFDRYSQEIAREAENTGWNHACLHIDALHQTLKASEFKTCMRSTRAVLEAKGYDTKRVEHNATGSGTLMGYAGMPDAELTQKPPRPGIHGVDVYAVDNGLVPTDRDDTSGWSNKPTTPTKNKEENHE